MIQTNERRPADDGTAFRKIRGQQTPSASVPAVASGAQRLTGREVDFDLLAGIAIGQDAGWGAALDAMERVAVDHARAGVELTVTEALRHIGADDRADYLCTILDDSRAALMDAARAASTRRDHVVLTDRRFPGQAGVEPLMAAARQHRRIWTGWDGGEAL